MLFRSISITFLDEQSSERLEQSKTKSKAGKASAEAKRLRKLAEIEQDSKTCSTENQQVFNS